MHRKINMVNKSPLMALQNMKAIYYNLALQVEDNIMPNKINSFWYPNSASAVVR